MTDDHQPDVQPDPMAKAIEGGYKPEAQPSREERARDRANRTPRPTTEPMGHC